MERWLLIGDHRDGNPRLLELDGVVGAMHQGAVNLLELDTRMKKAQSGGDSSPEKLLSPETPSFDSSGREG